MTTQTVAAVARFGAGSDPWSSIVAEACEAGEGSVYATAKLTAYETNRAIREDARYLEAIQVLGAGTAAWWVYGDKVRVSLLTDERAFAASMMNVSKDLEALVRNTLLIGSGVQSRSLSVIPEANSYIVQSRRLIRAAIEAASLDSAATVYPPVTYAVDYEEISFSNSSVETTRFRPNSQATVFFAGVFLSASSGLPLALHQNTPGVFSLSEPGYGMAVVSYVTTRQMVSVPYDLWTDSMSATAREAIARQAVLCGWPDSAPRVVALISREEAPEVQAMITAPRKVTLDIADAYSRVRKEAPKLKEKSRETETKTVAAKNDPSQTITFQRLKKITLRDQDGKLWTFEFVNNG